MTATHPDYAVVSFRDEDEERGRRSAREGGADVEFVLLSSLLLSHLEPSLPLCPLNSHPCPSVTLTRHQLAVRIAVSNLHKNTLKSFSET